jgi:hypothetical protein
VPAGVHWRRPVGPSSSAACAAGERRLRLSGRRSCGRRPPDASVRCGPRLCGRRPSRGPDSTRSLISVRPYVSREQRSTAISRLRPVPENGNSPVFLRSMYPASSRQCSRLLK